MGSERKVNVGLVIGNAGVKSLAALPFLRLFKDSFGKEVNFSASGAGATLVCLFLMGLSDEEIIKAFSEIYDRDKILKKFNKKTLFQMSTCKIRRRFDIGGSLYSKTPFFESLKTYFHNMRLEDLPSSVQIQLTDVNDSTGFLIDRGDLEDIIYGTNALYPVLSPIQIEDNWYVDGLFSASLPVDGILEHYDYDIIIAIGFQQNTGLVGDTFFEYYGNILNRTYTVGQSASVALSVLTNSDLHDVLFVKIPFEKNISIWDPSHLDYIYSQGMMHNQHLADVIEKHL